MNISRPGFYFCCLVTIAFAIFFFLAVFLDLDSFKGPRCYIQQFYVPVLDLSQNVISNSNNSNNKTIINPCLLFDLTFRNILTTDGLLYEDVNLTFSYGQNAVANYVIPSFYQRRRQTSHRREVVVSRGVPWENILMAVSNGSTVVFRVDLAAYAWRYHDSEGSGYLKRKDVTIGAEVEVDGSGMKVKKEDIRLD